MLTPKKRMTLVTTVNGRNSRTTPRTSGSAVMKIISHAIGMRFCTASHAIGRRVMPSSTSRPPNTNGIRESRSSGAEKHTMARHSRPIAAITEPGAEKPARRADHADSACTTAKIRAPAPRIQQKMRPLVAG